MATAGVVSRSLKSVLAGGLVVRYSVNEQVAGHFEVLLAASIAGASACTARSPPDWPRAPPQIVIAKSDPRDDEGWAQHAQDPVQQDTAKRLRRLGKVTLMLRLVVRNGSGKNALSTTVLSLVTLTH